MYILEPIKQYIDDLAARQSTPGGGSAAALSGALGTALLEMVCNFTIGNERYKEFADEAQENLIYLENIRGRFSELIDRDVEVYAAIRSAFKIRDKKVIDKALKKGYYISLNICELSRDGMRPGLVLADKGSVNLITDVGCGAELLNAAFNSSVFNAEINLKGMDDKVFVSRERSVLKALRGETAGLYQDVISQSKKRMEGE